MHKLSASRANNRRRLCVEIANAREAAERAMRFEIDELKASGYTIVVTPLHYDVFHRGVLRWANYSSKPLPIGPWYEHAVRKCYDELRRAYVSNTGRREEFVVPDGESRLSGKFIGRKRKPLAGAGA